MACVSFNVHGPSEGILDNLNSHESGRAARVTERLPGITGACLVRPRRVMEWSTALGEIETGRSSRLPHVGQPLLLQPLALMSAAGASFSLEPDITAPPRTGAAPGRTAG